jgi:hypothetical protein
MEAIRAKLSAKCTLAVAVTYALKRWPALTRYCEDGRLEIDNLIAERALEASPSASQLALRRFKGGWRTSSGNLLHHRNLQTERRRTLRLHKQRHAEDRRRMAHSRIDELMPWVSGAQSLSSKRHDDLRSSDHAYGGASHNRRARPPRNDRARPLSGLGDLVMIFFARPVCPLIGLGSRRQSAREDLDAVHRRGVTRARRITHR